MDLGRMTTSGRLISASGGTVPQSKDAAWVDGKSALLVGATKPGFSMGKAQILRRNVPNYSTRKFTPNFMTNELSLIY